MKKLGFGLMRLPLLDERDRSTVDVEALKHMVDRYLSRGFTYFTPSTGITMRPASPPSAKP